MCAFRQTYFPELSEADEEERTKRQRELEEKFAVPNPVPVYRDERDDETAIKWGQNEWSEGERLEVLREAIWETEMYSSIAADELARRAANRRRGPGRPRNFDVLSYPLPESEKQARSECSFTPDFVARFYWYLKLFTDRLARPAKRSKQRRQWNRNIRRLARRCAINDFREILDGPEGCYFLTEPLFALNKMQRREMRDSVNWDEDDWVRAWEVKLDNFVSARGRERPKRART